ncbi:MAG: hypothetical protein ABFD82_04855 [Syntrophaceae bacterium]
MSSNSFKQVAKYRRRLPVPFLITFYRFSFVNCKVAGISRAVFVLNHALFILHYRGQDDKAKSTVGRAGGPASGNNLRGVVVDRKRGGA